MEKGRGWQTKAYLHVAVSPEEQVIRLDVGMCQITVMQYLFSFYRLCALVARIPRLPRPCRARASAMR